MCKTFMQKYLFLMSILLVGCERSSLSPVEIKIDDDTGYTKINATVSGSTLMTTHVVANDETLFDVAYKYNVDPMNLAKINGISAPYDVRNGQILKIPTEDKPIAENPVLNYEDQRQGEESNKDIDKAFSGVLSTKGGFGSGAGESTAASNHSANVGKSTGTSFNEQAAELSVPKIEKAKNKPVAAKSVAVQPQSGKLAMPVKGNIVSHFGDMQEGVANDGINIKASLGSKVSAAANGKVIYAGNKLEEEFGNVVIVQHDDGLITTYAHLDKIGKKTGSTVRAGETLGTVGKTGDVQFPQLHFEVMKDKKPVNPMKYINAN